MNNDDLFFLRNNIRYLEFGEAMARSELLEEETQKGVEAFQLMAVARFDKWSTIQATLFIKRSEYSGMYALNKYDATLIYDSRAKPNRMQSFFIKKGTGVTFRQACNLLQGRSVLTTLWDSGEGKYPAWIQLSFCERTRDNTNFKVRQFRKNYGYDLEQVLNTFPIHELRDEQLKQQLLDSLKMGNKQLVTFTKADKAEKMYIAACPDYKTITIDSGNYEGSP
ncbi:MAG: hypothetical protein BGO55_08310 [Sphingobacteriales bacterium 50-39]|nr:hypothetical protein [Sphingobacteriales bacterium]OJW59265.1 MAG: hypothetical protein BGO55_08310 [Sphingobacteriales bacterium 50-39]